MAAEFEVFVNGCDSFVRCIILLDPASEYVAAVSFFAGSGENHDAAFADCVLDVVDGFLGLIQVDILRVAAGGNDDDISRLIDFDLVDAVEEFACFAVCCNMMACSCKGDFL